MCGVTRSALTVGGLALGVLSVRSRPLRCLPLGRRSSGSVDRHGGADGAGGTAVPSFSVLTASLLDPRLFPGSHSVTLFTLATVRRDTAVLVPLYAVSFSHWPSEHHKRWLWVRGHSLYRSLLTKGAQFQCLRPDL